LKCASFTVLCLTSANALAQTPPAEPASEPPPADAAPGASHEVVGSGEAAEEAKNEPAEADAVTAEEIREEQRAGGDQAEQEQIDEALAGGSAVELPDKRYLFVGARYRGIIIPKFVLNLFADGGDTVYLHGFGPEVAIRKNGFEYNLAAWLAFYSMDDTLFKGSSDGENAWEFVKSDMKILYLSSDFLWTNELAPGFGLNYGGALGLGLVFGDLVRHQAWRPDGTAAGNENVYQKCAGPGDTGSSVTPAVPDYCEGDEHLGEAEPSWANGGSKPIVFPWLALQTGIRYKPHRNFAARLDLGVGTSGFFFGLGADYGL
jgi:hypothetical protein